MISVSTFFCMSSSKNVATAYQLLLSHNTSSISVLVAVQICSLNLLASIRSCLFAAIFKSQVRMNFGKYLRSYIPHGTYTEWIFFGTLAQMCSCKAWSAVTSWVTLACQHLRLRILYRPSSIKTFNSLH